MAYIDFGKHGALHQAALRAPVRGEIDEDPASLRSAGRDGVIEIDFIGDDLKAVFAQTPGIDGRRDPCPGERPQRIVPSGKTTARE